MRKTKIKEFLKQEIAKDALYTEKQYSQNDGPYIECSVWSSAAGYTVTVKRQLNSTSRRHLQQVREEFLKQVQKEVDKFKVRFDYEEVEVDPEFNVLLNDGFEYEE